MTVHFTRQVTQRTRVDIALNVMVPSLKSTRWRIGSQCNCRAEKYHSLINFGLKIIDEK